MLKIVGVDLFNVLIGQIVLQDIQLVILLQVGDVIIEFVVLVELKVIVSCNKCFKFYIGMGYIVVQLLLVIQCNMLENLGWYIVYIFYQLEVFQGCLELLFNFQQVILDLIGLDIVFVLLFDEVIVVVEVMVMVKCVSKLKSVNCFFVVVDVYL